MDFLKNSIIMEDMIEINKRQNGGTWLNNSTVLITGAYGMLASYLVYYLIFLNESFSDININIVLQGRSKEKFIKRFGEYCSREYIKISTDNLDSDFDIAGKVDYIIHAASLASPEFYKTIPVDVLQPNSLGTFYLLELARRKNVKGFLFFSSGDVYGELPPRREFYSESDFGSLDCMNVRSCYGESKRFGETVCKAFSVQYNLPAFCVRIAHTYGPTMDIEHDRRLFSEFVKNIVNNENIEMKSDGTAKRMFCYITDAADAFLKILHFGEKGEAYNMYNNSQLISVKELAETLVSLFPEKDLRVIAMKRSENDSYVESPVTESPVMSTQKLSRLGWEPTHSVKDGFFRTVKSFEEMK